MRHTHFLTTAALAIAAFATAVIPNALAQEQGKIAGTTLVVYTPNEQGMLDSLVPVFEEKSGVEVQIVTAGTGELYQRVRSESANPQGDVMFGGGAAQANTNIELWEKYVSPQDSNMVDAGKNATGFFTPYQADGSNLLVNKDAASSAGLTITSYADLLKPELKGKIAFGDPTSSSSAFAQLTNILKAVGGDYESQQGWDFVRKLVTQLNGITISSSSQVAKDVAAGEYVVGLTYEPLSLNFVNSGAPVEIVYPKEGAAFLPATIQVIKGGPNQPAAKAFVDFVISEEGQTLLAEKTAGRPLRNGVTKPGLPALADIPTIQEDGPYVAKHRGEIVAKYKKVLEEAL
ncbi:extracellular solute-binding protein [Rhizobium sp. CFBP 8752]|uniref:extracellular solute-binding protein n=1 Tax=Rhizobium sp. CFBP 8752 TaxID=2775301 RepID=UPI000DE0C219|nr:extracellular solute-binding protein [Rhizobium sp. CFBP 8752]MBD8665753.1 extracellular solute-binding protein [Rhizobium sp. CFBP 8752]